VFALAPLLELGYDEIKTEMLDRHEAIPER
jgi:hypothetical protein